MYVAPFEPDRFEDAVPYYLKHRVRYADRLIARLAAEASLGSSSHVLDLGCGPGFVANMIAPHVQARSSALIRTKRCSPLRARKPKRPASRNVTYRVGSSFDLSITEGPFQLVTMGRSFHWMDRVATLASAGRLRSCGTASIALLSDHEPKAPENAWWDDLPEMCARPTGARTSSAKCSGASQWEPHVSILMRSAFSDVMHLGFYAHVTWTVDDLIGLALSQSSTTLRRLGEKKSCVRDMPCERRWSRLP